MKYRHLLREKIVVEQTSLKSVVYDHMKKIFAYKADFELLSMHVLFRPSATPNRDDRRVALINGAKWSKQELVTTVEAITQSNIVWFTDHNQHDRIMAYQQALLHRVMLVLNGTIDQFPYTFMSSQVNKLCLRIKAGDVELYKLMQKNKFLPGALKQFNKNLKHFRIQTEFKKG